MSVELARRVDAIPVVIDNTGRTSQFASPQKNQRVHNLATGDIERYDGAAWVTAIAGSGASAVLNVKDAPYGAVGDGVTDDTASIQAALDAAQGVADAVVYFPRGTYNVTAINGTGSASLVLRGDSAEASILFHIASAVANLFTCNDTILRVEGLGFDGNKSNQTNRYSIIYYTNTGGTATSCYVDRCVFVNSVSAAIEVNSIQGVLHIGRCRILSMAEHGGTTGQVSKAVDVNSTAAAEVYFVDNWVVHDEALSDVDSAPGGIFVAGVSLSCGITGNYFRNLGQRKASNFAAAIQLYTDADHTVITGNRIDNFRYGAIAMQNALQVTCADNVIVGAVDASSSSAILLQYARTFGSSIGEAAITGNVIEAGGNVGIKVDGDAVFDTRHVTVANNVVRNTLQGILVTQAAWVLLNGNIVDTASAEGVYIKDAPSGAYVGLVGGIVRNCSSYGLRANNADTALELLVEGNCFEANATRHMIIDGPVSAMVMNNRLVGAPTTILEIGNVTDVSVQGNLADNSTIVYGTITNLMERNNSWQLGPATLANTATPSVQGVELAKTGGTTTVTNFTNGVVGQTISVRFDHIVTITDGTSMLLTGSVNFVGAVGDVLTLTMFSAGVWEEVSRKVN